MPRKSTEDLIEELAVSVARGFDEVTQHLRGIDGRVEAMQQQLERVEFLIAGHDRRLSTVEDRVRQLAHKAGLTFN